MTPEPTSHDSTLPSTTRTAAPTRKSMSAPTARRKYPTDCTSRATASPVIVSSWAIRTRTGGGSVAMGTVKQMDLDALTAARRQEWARLDELSRARRTSGAQVGELVTRTRGATASHADVKHTPA